MSRNFYWVPGNADYFRLGKDRLHAHARSAPRRPDGACPPASCQIDARAEIENTAHGRELTFILTIPPALAFQIRAAVRTASGGLIAPVFWSDNWIELTPGETTTLTAQLPEGDNSVPTVKIEGWNVAPTTLTPTTGVAAR